MLAKRATSTSSASVMMDRVSLQNFTTRFGKHFRPWNRETKSKAPVSVWPLSGSTSLAAGDELGSNPAKAKAPASSSFGQSAQTVKGIERMFEKKILHILLVEDDEV